MRPIVTDGVTYGLSVCHDCEPFKNGWTDQDVVWDEDLGGPKESCILGCTFSHVKRQFWGEKGWPRICPAIDIYSKQLSRRQYSSVDAYLCVPGAVHIGTKTWWIRLNRLYVPAVRLMSNYFDHLFMVALCNRETIYIFMLWFVLPSSSSFFFFPRLISAAADWMSAILPHMVWP